MPHGPLLFLLGLLLAGGEAPPACSGPRLAGSAAPLDLLLSLNVVRAAAGLAPVHLNAALCKVATTRATELAASGSLEPKLSSIGAVSQRIFEQGLRTQRWSEQPILRRGDGRAFLDAWKKADPVGFRNAALGDMSELGIGWAELEGTPLLDLLLALPHRTQWLRDLAALGDVETLRTRLIAAANAARRAAGLPDLIRNPHLDTAAQAHATDMVDRDFYDHVNPDGMDLRGRLDRSGYIARVAAENLARGFFTPEETVEHWLASSGHRRNLLAPQVREIGAGVAVDARERRETLSWVLDFGAER